MKNMLLEQRYKLFVWGWACWWFLAADAVLAVRLTGDKEIGAAETGEIYIVVDVPKVKIVINGEAEGLAHPDRPLTRRFFPAGKADINALAKDYPLQTQSVMVKGGEQTVVEFLFQKPAEPGDQTRKTGKAASDEEGSSIEQLLREGEAYYERERYTTPHDENAFAIYKTILTKDPHNEKARSRIYAMMKQYLDWGEKYRQANLGRVIFSYQQYLILAEFAAKVLGDLAILEPIAEIQRRVHELSSAHEKITILLAAGDKLYKAQKYMDDYAANAFQYYREALDLEPENRQALRRIQAMMNDYHQWGDKHKERSPSTALQYYANSMMLAEYLWRKTSDRRYQHELSKLEQKAGRFASINKLLAKAEALFEAEQFVSPENANALMYCRQILRLDPEHQAAAQMIQDMMNYSKSMGDRAYSDGNFALAGFYYRQHNKIVAEIAKTAGVSDQVHQDYDRVFFRLREADRQIIMKRLIHQNRLLQQNLIRYQTLKHNEASGRHNLMDEIMSTLEKLIEDLAKIEVLYLQISDEAWQLDDKIEHVRETRRRLEREYDLRSDKAA